MLSVNRNINLTPFAHEITCRKEETDLRKAKVGRSSSWDDHGGGDIRNKRNPLTWRLLPLFLPSTDERVAMAEVRWRGFEHSAVDSTGAGVRMGLTVQRLAALLELFC